MTSTSRFTLTASSALSDDYIYTSDTLLNLAQPSALGVFATDAGPNALFARIDGALCQLSPADGENTAGWSVTTVGSASGVTQAVAGTQNDGTIHGFYTDANKLYHIAFDGSAWSAPASLPLCSGLQATVNQTTGELIVTGVDADGNLLFVRQSPTDGSWQATSITFEASLAGTRPVLALTNPGCDWVMATPGVGSQLNLFQGSPTSLTSGPQVVPVKAPVAQVVLAFWQSNSPLFLFTDSQFNLYATVGSSSSVVQISQASVASAAAILDQNSRLHVYTVSPAGVLSVLHQTGWNNTTGPVWAPIIPLASDIQLVFTDTNPLDATAFFAVDPEGALSHYRKVTRQDGARVWASGKAQTPGGAKNFQVPLYRTEIRVVDENGSPAAGYALTVSASRETSVLVKGVAQAIGPSRTLTVTTNPVGRVTLSTIASGLHAPQLSFEGPGLWATAPHNAADGIQSYLRGEGVLNQGTSRVLPMFGPNTLQQATVDGQPLAPATQDPSNGSDLAQAAASGITSMFKIHPKPDGTSALAAAGVVGFSIDFSNPDRPAYVEYRSSEALAAAQRKLLHAHGGLAADSWWDDVAGFFEDVLKGIENGVIAVVNVVVHAAVDLAVQIGDEIHKLVNLAVKDIETIAAVVAGILAKIEAAIEAVIDWLKMVFDWDAIWNTAKALESALTQAFPYLQNVISNDAEPLVNGFFAKLETLVTDSFDKVIAGFDQGQTLASLSGSTSRLALQATGALRRPAAAGFDIGQWISGVQHNWLLEKIESYLGGGSFDSVDALAQPLETLKTAFDTVFTDFQTAAVAFANFVQTAITEPKDFPTIGVADFLVAAKSVALAVLAFLDGIIEAFLQVISIAIGAVGTILLQPLEVPFLSSLIERIASLLGITLPSVSFAKLFCLGFAIPITLVYKIVNGAGEQPFPGGNLPDGAARLASGGSDAAKACQFVAAGLAALWAVFDTGLDAVPSASFLAFKVIDVIAPTLIGIFSWPGFIPFSSVALDTPEDRAAFANWIIGWGVVALDIALLVTSSIDWAKESTMARYQDPVGKILLTAIGAIQLISGIVASALGTTGGSIAANILGPMPLLMQFLRLQSLVEGSEEVTLAIKLVIDFFAGEGTAVAIASS